MDDVTSVLDRTFPGRRVASATPAPRGNTKETTLVTFADGEGVVVQFADHADAFGTELALARAVSERTSVPTPRVLAVGELGGRPYAVVERVAGADLHERFAGLDEATRTALAREFGRYLAALHEAFAFESYGSVRLRDEGADAEAGAQATSTEGVDDDRTEGGASFVVESAASAAASSPAARVDSSWPAWFEAYARAGIDALPPAFEDLRPALLAAVESAALPENPPSRLYPWDLRPGNAVFDGNEVTAVLDWGNPLAAAPGLAAAKTEHLVADWYVEDGTPLREAFRAGYESVRAYPNVPPVYRLVAVVRSAVDSRGVVTRPRYPEIEGDEAVRFHRERMREWLSGDGGG